MVKRVIVQYIYYTDDSNINDSFLYPKGNSRSISSYLKDYELQDDNFNDPVFHEVRAPSTGYPHFMESYFFNQNKLPYGSKNIQKPKPINNSNYRHNNAYNSSHNKKTRYYDNNSSDSYRKKYKDKYVKEEENRNSEVKSKRNNSSLQEVSPSNYKPSFIYNRYNNPAISTPMYIKVNNPDPVLEKILSNRKK